MDKERAGIQSVEVGFTLLQALAGAGPLMLKDLAGAAGMSAAKAHRYLVSFQRLDLVVQDARGRYDLGPAALHLGLAAAPGPGAPGARTPAGTAGADSAHAGPGRLGQPRPHHGALGTSPQAVVANLRLGDVMPLLSSATGRCFAAWMPPALTAPLLAAELLQAGSSARSDLPRTDAALQQLLAGIRQQGCARVIDTLLPGTAAFCAPVFNASGHLALGILSLGATAGFDTAWGGSVHTPLQSMAQQLSHDLGHRAMVSPVQPTPTAAG
jgi:DNA-binding IclR family transcriptional regulator